MEIEITAMICKTQSRTYEVPISYYGRTYQEGKKINWKDGLRAIYVIVKYGLFSQEAEIVQPAVKAAAPIAEQEG